MASLVKKIKQGKAYYYVVESARVDGKPRIVKQTYLGTVEAILKAHQQQVAPVAQEVQLTHFGPMALWDLAVSLNLPEMIDATFPKREQGPTMSQFILLAAIGRAFAPCSKVKIGQLYEKTSLLQHWGHKGSAFTSQRFWEAMDRIELEHLTKLEQQISLHIARQEKLSIKALLYDCTNYFTYIDTQNKRNGQAQRGHNKQGRHDLKQLGLAVAVTPDFHIPLFHNLYPGNINDITEFYAIFDSLVDRFSELSSNGKELTLILDRGNMSEGSLFLLQQKEIAVIAAASIHNHPELQNINLEQFQEVDRENLPGVTAHRSKKEIAGYEWTMVMEYSTSLAVKQQQVLVCEQAKAIAKLEELSNQLRQHLLPKATITSIKEKVAQILKAQHLKKIINTFVELKNDYPTLSYSLNHTNLQQILNNIFGRHLLITNRHNWSSCEIIMGYRGQFEVERFFQESKDTDYLSFQPPYHWTDQKLHIHAFYCVLALALIGVLRRRLSLQGVVLPTNRLLEQLHALQEATLLYPSSQSNSPRLSYCVVRPTEIQKDLIKLLDLSKHIHQQNPNSSTLVSE